MRGALFVRGLLAVAALTVASQARAQFVQFSRCQAAYPCNVPFGLQYNPDPLIAGQWSNVQPTLASVHLDPTHPIALPVLDVSKELEKQDFAREAARVFVLRHPVAKPAPVAANPPPATGASPPPKTTSN